MLPLSGIRVLDLTTVLAGPFCSYQLGLLGADVIKVERPGRGETLRHRPNGNPKMGADGMSLAFVTQSSNKRCITLNLDSVPGQRAFLKLASSCDVVVENLRSGALERRGIGYETVKALRPDVIWCAISAYGRTGPKCDHPGYDSVVQAWTGMMEQNGPPGSDPLRIGAPVVDYATGVSGAFAVAAALLQRHKTGGGQYIDLSMVDASLMLMASVATETVNAGVAPPRAGNRANSGNPCSTTYHTADGLLSVAVNEQHQLRNLLGLLGLEGLLNDPRFITPTLQSSNGVVLRSHVQEVLLQRSAHQWEHALNAAGVPAARVRTLVEALREREEQGRSIFHRFSGGEESHQTGLQVPLAAFRFAENGPCIRTGPRSVGSDTAEVFRELGFSSAEIAQLELEGAN